MANNSDVTNKLAMGVLAAESIFKDVREAFKEYVKTEGCGCCEDYKGHREAAEKLGKLLDFKPYSDGSGYDFYENDNDDNN